MFALRHILRHPVVHTHRQSHADCHDQNQGTHARATARGALEGTRRFRQSRNPFGFEHRNHKNIQRIQPHQQQAGFERCLIHIADRYIQLTGQYDQHQRRRNDLRQRARGCNHTRGHAIVITITAHQRQRNQTHRNHTRCNHACGGRQQTADQNNRIGQTAAHRAEQLPDGVEQILGHARSLQYQPHKGKKRHGQQRIVHDRALEHPPGQRLQTVGIINTERNADHREGKTGRRQRKRNRETRQQKKHQADEHQRGDILNQKFHVCTLL